MLQDYQICVLFCNRLPELDKVSDNLATAKQKYGQMCTRRHNAMLRLNLVNSEQE